MKAFLINPFNHTVIEVQATDWRDIVNHLKCDIMTVASRIPLPNKGSVEATVYVDDNGLFVEDQSFFQHKGYPEPLAGMGLVIGTDRNDGESADCPCDLDFVNNSVTFLSPPNYKHPHAKVQTEKATFNPCNEKILSALEVCHKATTTCSSTDPLCCVHNTGPRPEGFSGACWPLCEGCTEDECEDK